MILCAVVLSALVGQTPALPPGQPANGDMACGGLDRIPGNAGPYAPRTRWQRFRTGQILADGADFAKMNEVYSDNEFAALRKDPRFNELMTAKLPSIPQ